MASVSIRTLQYRARVAALQQQLGGKCAVCPATTALEFDCIIPAAPVVETVVPQPWGAIAGGLISLASSVAAMYAARHSRSAATASATATAMLSPTPGPNMPKQSS